MKKNVQTTEIGTIATRFQALLEQILVETEGHNGEPVRSDSRLDELGLTSVDFLELTISIEHEFAIDIPQDALLDRSLASVGEWTRYIEDQLPS